LKSHSKVLKAIYTNGKSEIIDSKGKYALPLAVWPPKSQSQLARKARANTYTHPHNHSCLGHSFPSVYEPLFVWGPT